MKTRPDNKPENNDGRPFLKTSALNAYGGAVDPAALGRALKDAGVSDFRLSQENDALHLWYLPATRRAVDENLLRTVLLEHFAPPRRISLERCTKRKFPVRRELFTIDKPVHSATVSILRCSSCNLESARASLLEHFEDATQALYIDIPEDGEGPLIASDNAGALSRVRRALNGEDIKLDGLRICGIQPEVARFPAFVIPADPDGAPVKIAAGKECEALPPHLCPTDAISAGPAGLQIETARCIRCYCCVEAHPEIFVPTQNTEAAVFGRLIDEKPGFMARLPENEKPVFLYAASGRKPRYVLGLAVATMQEHAAALLCDGQLIGAVEEERFTRKRHYGWQPPNRPGTTLALDPTLPVEAAFCNRSIDWLLKKANIKFEDIDIVAINGLPARFRRSYSHSRSSSPLPLLRSGRVVYVPHHLAHAASAFYASGYADSHILTVDGRGDRETAAFFRADENGIRQVFEILSLSDSSIGGVYETVTRLLGFGPHGQGSTMALASYGIPEFDLSPFLKVRSLRNCAIHENGIFESFGHLERKRSDELNDAQRNLAASLQKALEESLYALVKEGVGSDTLQRLCMAGGVALNCRANETLRRRFGLEEIFIQPAANDAGTALGAAFEAHRFAYGERPGARMQSALSGPAFSRDEVRETLKRLDVAFSEPEDPAAEAAHLLATGEVLCLFEGAMEYGPRALGARSIIADPRRADNNARINQMKNREAWRPFGPSVLAGHENAWFERAFDSRFMLFTQKIKPSKLALIPAVAHVDGSTRPQVVHREIQPFYHSLISEFLRLTGVPMVLNTSFNAGGEPIVCTPADALKTFMRTGADILLIEGLLVYRR